MTPRKPGPIDVECPVCGAGIGWPCRTFDSMDEGVIRNLARRYCAWPHTARIRAAEQARREKEEK